MAIGDYIKLHKEKDVRAKGYGNSGYNRTIPLASIEKKMRENTD